MDALRQCGVRAACLNSTLDFAEVRAVEAAVNGGNLDLLYIAPERLLQERTLEWLDAQTIALFAIDEAHCVSRWGHDFREEYLQLSVLHERYPSVPRIALTATADQATRREIITQLQLEEANAYVHSCDRPNIRYAIFDDDNGRERMWRFLQSEHPADAGHRLLPDAQKKWRRPPSGCAPVGVTRCPTTRAFRITRAAGTRSVFCAKRVW